MDLKARLTAIAMKAKADKEEQMAKHRAETALANNRAVEEAKELMLELLSDNAITSMYQLHLEKNSSSTVTAVIGSEGAVLKVDRGGDKPLIKRPLSTSALAGAWSSIEVEDRVRKLRLQDIGIQIRQRNPVEPIVIDFKLPE
jgi:hypothetical protein